MTIFLTERDVESLISMKDVVESVEEAFRRQGAGEAQNHMRSRTRGQASVLSVMHANSSYLGRGGVKAYMSSGAGAKFLVMLFDAKSSSPLAVMGADVLGRYRTGAASGVATKHLYGSRSATVALYGSGRQALTQALALDEVLDVRSFRVWSPDPAHRATFVQVLRKRGLEASSCESASEAARGAEVVSSITSSKEAFLDVGVLRHISHANVCGGNIPDRSEITVDAVASFDAVVVDDLAQAKAEYGDLILAAKAGKFDWEGAVELCDVVSGKVKPSGRTLFKSGGAAIEDVAAASLVYDRAVASGRFPENQLV